MFWERFPNIIYDKIWLYIKINSGTIIFPSFFPWWCQTSRSTPPRGWMVSYPLKVHLVPTGGSTTNYPWKGTISKGIYTWNPNDPCFDWKRPCFGGVKAKNRGQTGSRYIYIYIYLYSFPSRFQPVVRIFQGTNFPGKAWTLRGVDYTWRIIPFSKYLVTSIYKPFRPFIRGITPVRGLTNHGY